MKRNEIDAIRNVAFDIDSYDLKHYNDETKGGWEEAQEGLDKLYKQISDLHENKTLSYDSYADLYAFIANLRCGVDSIEHKGVQSSLIRSKHLHNFLQAARNRKINNYHNLNVDHVEVRLPWYLVGNLIEQLYLKYHKTEIHKYYDLFNKYFTDDKEDHEDYKSVYAFWKEVRENYRDDEDDEDTISNHYHTHDKVWQYGVDPKDCKNLKDFFKKRIRRIRRAVRKKIIVLQKKEIALRKKEVELKILRAQKHRLRNYTSLKKYSEDVPGSVYLFKDINKKFQKNEHSILYVGESRNMQKRFNAYQPRENGKMTELEKKLQNKFPKINKKVIQEFVRDPEQCKIRVISYKFLRDNWKRKNYESRLIRRVKPLLNRENIKND